MIPRADYHRKTERTDRQVAAVWAALAIACLAFYAAVLLYADDVIFRLWPL